LPRQCLRYFIASVQADLLLAEIEKQIALAIQDG
jgi:hypothetical protein